MARNGFTLVETMVCLFLIAGFSLVLVGFPHIVARFSDQMDLPFMMLKVNQELQKARYAAISNMQVRSIVFRQDQKVKGFSLNSLTAFRISYRGAIEVGGSVSMKKNKVTYRVSIRPVTGSIGLHFEKRVIRFADLL